MTDCMNERRDNELRFVGEEEASKCKGGGLRKERQAEAVMGKGPKAHLRELKDVIKLSLWHY